MNKGSSQKEMLLIMLSDINKQLDALDLQIHSTFSGLKLDLEQEELKKLTQQQVKLSYIEQRQIEKSEEDNRFVLELQTAL